MEKLYYDLSKSEFTNSRKILVWLFSGVFILAGIGIIILSTVFHDKSITLSLSIAPFGIGLFTGLVAYQATVKKKDHFFLMDDNGTEYRFGMFKPVRVSHKWTDIKQMIIPHKEKKILLRYNDGSDHIVNLTWIEKKKSHHIRKHFYYAAKEKNIELIKVNYLPKK
jgi:hypothetical protein